MLLVVVPAVTALLLVKEGSARNQFGSLGDEAAHYVTALMIHDYIHQGFAGSPMAFAQDYYEHLPKVAFGAWPPLFHILLAGWMLVFPTSVPSVRVFTALITAAFVAAVMLVSRSELSWRISSWIGAMTLATPLVVWLSSLVMVDTLHAIGCLASVFLFAKYIVTHRASYAIGWGLVTAIAFLTKNNAVLLLVAMPIVLVLLRGWSIFRGRAFWLGTAIVLVLVAPWEWLALRLAVGLMTRTESFRATIPTYTSAIVDMAGLPILLLASAGLVHELWSYKRERRAMTPLCAAAIGLILGTWLTHVALPGEMFPRYMLPALPGLLFLAGCGLEWAASLGGRVVGRVVFTVVALAALCWGTIRVVKSPAQPDSIFPVVADYISGHYPSGIPCTILVSSAADGEGMLISEMASRGRPRVRWILRASKVLSHSGWHGEGYALTFSSPQQVNAYLESRHVQLIVFDETTAHHVPRDHQLLAETLKEYPGEWKKIFAFRGGEECHGYCNVDLYRSQGPFATPETLPHDEMLHPTL